MQVTATGISHPGRIRHVNEDSFFVGATVFAVADGVGGRQAGDVASVTALGPVAALNDVVFSDADAAIRALSAALESSHRQVIRAASAAAERHGMSTTLTALALHDESIVLAHVGDSRAYLLREGHPMMQLTSDHTVVAEMIDAGILRQDETTRHPWRNIVSRAVGAGEHLEVDRVGPIDLLPGDRVLLCSDGLTDTLSDGEIVQTVNTVMASDHAVQALIRTANERGGRDNITVVLLSATDDGG